MQPRTRPIQRVAAAASQCTAEAAVYGKCIVADYNAVHKDKCAAEFMKLKDCYLHAKKVSRRAVHDIAHALTTARRGGGALERANPGSMPRSTML
ncbi:hypothetical protein SPBR_02086 [Sporothrix brasiliensis 5110]|uniref:IMS import disulfide relay-system CHCH-CHCH-like Cx9C domain-containing protein n=1 Tax=Sporothrix brasiliensis 5110 TaxID=1398154 RepID=A0A0C2IXH4_9PEZI|nr:uncharacterized protein SPBR_02086 [Sporothrix brasiliensis 5110]KIH91455.1 hypothetical protein SPBR_02086 [Sporothrix brasiliensis 5110]